MPTPYEIPLATGSQRLRVTLAGVSYRLALTWRSTCWFLDIADVNGNPLVSGIGFVPGVDLLGQYAYLGIGGSLWVVTDGDPNADPTYESLGVTTRLYFVTP